MNADAKTAAEMVFRQESGRILATLIRFSGSFDRAEEAMQEAFSAALTSWPEKGIPQNPAGWITAAAHRKVIDQSRREKTRQDKQDSLRYETKIFAYSNNHAVAVPMSEGLEQGLILIDQLGDIDELKSYYLYHAARA